MQSEVSKNTCNFRSLSVSLLGNSTAIRQLLQQKIFAVMSLSAMGIGAIDFSKGTELTPRMIPMRRLSDDTPVVYRSAIALKLSPLAQLSALDIAHQLMASLPSISPDTTTSMGLDFTVEVVFPGWISFQLSEYSLATWLQYLIQIFPLEERGRWGDGEMGRKGNKEADETQPYTQNLFQVQYAHARCCSLLRLAHQQGLIKLRDWDFKTLSWQLVEPNPIPFFTLDAQQMRLQLVHPAERRLIAQIVDLIDQISDQEQRNLPKLASALSSAFENFYSSCRIWGEVKTKTPKLTQARLGLVGATQVSLRSLLENQLGVSAPIEL